MVGTSRAAAAARRSPTRTLVRSRLAVVVAGCVVLVAGVVAALHSATGGGAAALQAWQAAILPPVQHWGRIEIEGMQPAISDLRAGAGVPAVSIAGEAQAWQRGLLDIRSQMDSAATPGDLRSATHLFDQALALYLQAAETVEQAASGPSAVRIALIDQAVHTAMRGDCAYDDASVALQHARVAAGLGTTTEFPDHPCTSAGGGG